MQCSENVLLGLGKQGIGEAACGLSSQVIACGRFSDAATRFAGFARAPMPILGMYKRLLVLIILVTYFRRPVMERVVFRNAFRVRSICRVAMSTGRATQCS